MTDDDVFELNDFTCVSKFEKLVHEIQNIFNTWQVHLACPPDEKVKEDRVYQEELIKWNGCNYILKYFNSRTANNIEIYSDSQDGRNQLQKTLGLNAFITCKSQSNSIIMHHDQSTELLSALQCAMTNIQSHIPVLVCDEDGVWQGGAYESGIRIDVRAVSKAPYSLQYLSGMVHYFESHLKRLYIPIFTKELIENIQTYAACSLTYYKEHDNDNDDNDKYNNNNNNDNNTDNQNIKQSKLERMKQNCLWRDTEKDELLTFGAFWGPQLNPIEGTELTVKWSFFASGAFVENAVYSDLNPLQAPFWYINIYWTRDGHELDSPLSCSVREIVKLSHYHPETKQNRRYKRNENKQTSSVASIKSSISKAAHNVMRGSIISQEDAECLMDNVFAKECPECDEIICNCERFPLPINNMIPDSTRLPAPFGSLLSRFVFSILSLYTDNLLTDPTIETLWHLFTKRIRYYYETKTSIPYISDHDKIDFHTALIHQKLQLINICISTENERNKYKNNHNNNNHNNNNEDIKDDGIGRKYWLENTYLKNHSSIKLYVPITQRECELTYDLFQEEEELYQKLGSNQEASNIRMQMQTKGLSCDMSAFKAANPKCVFEDFVRWHSPSDIDCNGELSIRMKSKDCKWQHLFRDAISLPAWEQPLLFNPQKEAERALNWMENMILHGDLLRDLSSISASHTICVLNRTDGSKKCKEIIEYLNNINTIINKRWIYDDITLDDCDILMKAELLCARACSLLYMFPDSIQMINNLLQNQNSNVISQEEKTFLSNMFHLHEDNQQVITTKQSFLSMNKTKMPINVPIRRDYAVISKFKDKQINIKKGGIEQFFNRMHVTVAPDEYRMSTMWNPYIL